MFLYILFSSKTLDVFIAALTILTYTQPLQCFKRLVGIMLRDWCLVPEAALCRISFPEIV